MKKLASICATVFLLAILAAIVASLVPIHSSGECNSLADFSNRYLSADTLIEFPSNGPVRWNRTNLLIRRKSYVEGTLTSESFAEWIEENPDMVVGNKAAVIEPAAANVDNVVTVYFKSSQGRETVVSVDSLSWTYKMIISN
jgi:hypothetical protein